MKRKEKMQKLKEKGLSYQAIADLFKISRSRVHQVISGYNSGKLTYRKNIFTRDNYQCQWKELCKGKDVLVKNLIIHHIDFDDENNKPNNLITLCKKCHSKFHRQNHINNKIEKNLQGSQIKKTINNKRNYKIVKGSFPKNKQTGIRITAEEYRRIKIIAKKNKVSFSEASSALIRSALKNLK